MPYFFALFITSKYFVLLYKYVFCVFRFYQLCLPVDGFRVESYQLVVIHSNRQPSQCVQKPSNISLHFYSFEWQLSYSILNSSLVTMIRMADIGSLCKKTQACRTCEFQIAVYRLETSNHFSTIT